ncbi:cyd operon protein YbgE [Leminorella richardii]|uniref:Cyd operon protein YbgE n=1 Tax=Leminorella richardii TaxID=158841 RepID=A0A2X4XYE2_9GAMM|nr:cyd operon protein YbgE [Leminorella richardii]SQI41594.1 cyd operon protein YbgE [Leminorella richardii]
MGTVFNKLYAVMDKGPLRALSLILAFSLAFCVFWDPSRFAAKTSVVAVWQSFLVMWAICTGVVHGVGFRPKKTLWKAFFTPLPAIAILIAGLAYFLA